MSKQTKILALGYGATKTRRWKKWLSFVKRFSNKGGKDMKKAIVMASVGFWMFFYAHPGKTVHVSRAFTSWDECHDASVQANGMGWWVSNCRDSDNIEAGND